ncbi:MAG: tryptophan-rich sensory protein [Eubacteriaceae bacterium]|nr:tryptophan-rich sensory protein [Eubacteriaceae bacterium]
MTSGKSGKFIKYMVLVSFIVMVAVNALANILPINGVGTGQVSDSYPNLFAPAGITFAIWGVIYLLLAGFTLYQLGFFQIDKYGFKSYLLERVGIYFSISSIINALWIFSWHYRVIPLSMILMILILICLIVIIQELRKVKLLPRENLFIRLPFSIYFGWITVATIANATTLLVSAGWDGFGISQQVWTVIILSIGLIIGIAAMVMNKDMAYGLVIIWAYAGILLKHTSASGFAGQYPEIKITVILCIFLLLLAEVYLIVSNKRKLD